MKNNSDLFSKANALGNSLTNLFVCYFVITGASNEISNVNISNNIYLKTISWIVSCLASYASFYLYLNVNKINQKKKIKEVDSNFNLFDDFSVQDQNNEDMTYQKENEKSIEPLSCHDKYVLTCAIFINICFSIFPSLFLFNILTGPDEKKDYKIGAIVASGFFGFFSSVATYRNTKNLLQSFKND